MNITNHTQLLNYLIEKHGLKSYLEIGVQSTAQNFDKIKCSKRVAVDPCLVSDYILKKPQKEQEAMKNIVVGKTSDDFFNDHSYISFDLIFIDGLHHADQVERDFNNSLACLNDGGYVVIHDTLPDEEQYTTVPRGTKRWFGDVYKFACRLNSYEEINFVTINMDCGCTIVWVDKNKQAGKVRFQQLDWSVYKTFGTELLRIIQPSEIEKYF